MFIVTEYAALNSLRKKDKMLGKPHVLSLFLNSFNIFKKHKHSCKILYEMIALPVSRNMTKQKQMIYAPRPHVCLNVIYVYLLRTFFEQSYVKKTKLQSVY